MAKKASVEETVRTIRRQTKRQYNAEEKIRIVLEGLRGEDTVAELLGIHRARVGQIVKDID